MFQFGRFASIAPFTQSMTATRLALSSRAGRCETAGLGATSIMSTRTGPAFAFLLSLAPVRAFSRLRLDLVVFAMVAAPLLPRRYLSRAEQLRNLCAFFG